MMNKIKQGVEALVEQEYNLASKDHGEKFHSAHEAYAVILEEVEEAEEQMLAVKDYLEAMWQKVRSDFEPVEDLLATLDFPFAKQIQQEAILLACEAIQVAAMAHKALKSFEKEG